jgi:hypothetical protein
VIASAPPSKLTNNASVPFNSTASTPPAEIRAAITAKRPGWSWGDLS